MVRVGDGDIAPCGAVHLGMNSDLLCSQQSMFKVIKAKSLNIVTAHGRDFCQRSTGTSESNPHNQAVPPPGSQ